jgi:Rieske Fe-S protein
MDDSATVEPACRDRCASRRSVVAAAGATGVAALLAGCQVYDEPPPPPIAGPSGSSGGAARPVARVGEIPVGGGRIFAAERVVLSQPESGRIRAFSTVCTHQGCAVDQIADGTINCPCHGSKFAVADGSVVAGPARRPLPELPVRVENDTILLT